MSENERKEEALDDELIATAEMSDAEGLEAILRPAWEEACCGHWTSYVPVSLRPLWSRLSTETRFAVYLTAARANESGSRAMDRLD
jgi:hypothetical protein